jgi:uncharacterized protein YqiB (DUF1249 family)
MLFLMVSFKDKNGHFFQPKLKRLQELQTEIFRQLQLLIPDQVAHYDSFQSRVPGSPLLRMDILERHPYTHFLRLTYQFEKGEKHEIAPDAHIRLYNDARLAEVTSFNPEQGFDRLAHPGYPQHHLFQRSWRQNRTLEKWLGYLLHQGHSIASMRPASGRINENPTSPTKQANRSL